MKPHGFVVIVLMCVIGCSWLVAAERSEPDPAAVVPMADPPRREGPGTQVVEVGFVDPSGTLIFLPAKAGGIEAVELATGKPVWTNKGAGNLVGAFDSWVVGWVPVKNNVLRVTLCDAATGKTITTSDPIELPGWATLGAIDGDGWSFLAVTWRAGGRVNVAWAARTWYNGGPPPPPPVEEAARHFGTGLVRIDPKTGKVTPTRWRPTDGDLQAWMRARYAPKAAGYEFELDTGPPSKTTDLVEPRRLVVSRDGQKRWHRDIAGKPIYFPRP